jgi:hypothetical protein
VGGNAAWLPLLQFLAKFLDIFMLTSIATVPFEYICNQITRHDMPFGAVFSALQVTSLSYLWSGIFGSLTSPALRGRRKLLFLAFVPLSMLLTAGVGPSFAIALIPRQTSLQA